MVSLTNSAHEHELIFKNYLLIPSLCDIFIQMKTEKFVKPREPIDFAHYRSKCNLTKSGFLVLEVRKHFEDSSSDTILQTIPLNKQLSFEVASFPSSNSVLLNQSLSASNNYCKFPLLNRNSIKMITSPSITPRSTR